MTKKTLIFDASFMSENVIPGSARSGIYFTAYNILLNLVKSNEFDISLFCNTACNTDFINFTKNNIGKNTRVYFGNRYAFLLNQLAVLDKKLRARKHNIIKLLLNIFVRKPIKLFGKISKLPEFDVAISPYEAISDKIRAKSKYIILYDTIPLILPEYFVTENKASWFSKLVKYIKNGPKCKYFAISEHTKNDFVRLLDMNPDDITVMPLAAGDNFYRESDKDKIKNVLEKYNIPNDKKYVFSLCTLEPRKNLIRAVKTFIEFIRKNNIDDMVYVLGGGHWDKFINKLESEISDIGEYRNKIIRAGYIDDNDLASLYSGAEFFIYTSEYEGFGLPPIEAMACGCPVITSNNSSIPEVVGDAAIMIDFDSDVQHIAAYEKYYNDKEYKETMAKKGLEHVKMFSWDKTVKIIIDEINKG